MSCVPEMCDKRRHGILPKDPLSTHEKDIRQTQTERSSPKYLTSIKAAENKTGDTLRMGESSRQGISLQYTPTAHAAHYTKKPQTTQTKNGWKTQLGIYPKKIHRWLKSTGKNAQYHKLLEKCKIKTTKSYHCILVRMPIIKTPTNNKCWRRCGEKGTPLHCWWECTLVGIYTVCSAQSCLSLCDPMDCSLPGSSVHGIFQARILE